MKRCVILLLTLTACASDGATDPDRQPFTASYTQFVGGYASVEDCRTANQGTVFNCTASLTLCDNGGLQIIVTDIVNEGRYTRDGDLIVAQMLGGADVPFDIQLTLTGESFTSPQLGGSEPWVRVALDATQLAAVQDSCATMEGRLWW